MLCSLLMLLALGTLRLIGAANVGAQQSRPTSAGGVKFAAPAAARKSTRPPVATTRRATAGTQAMSYRGEAAAAGTINADGSISPPGSADGQG